MAKPKRPQKPKPPKITAAMKRAGAAAIEGAPEVTADELAALVWEAMDKARPK